uniref:Uncharacterized protein n=1 Tax=Arundo donax TaxID=35708 RepID=A0A0A9D975_ARUDO
MAVRRGVAPRWSRESGQPDGILTAASGQRGVPSCAPTSEHRAEQCGSGGAAGVTSAEQWNSSTVSSCGAPALDPARLATPSSSHIPSDRPASCEDMAPFLPFIELQLVPHVSNRIRDTDVQPSAFLHEFFSNS